MKEVPVTLPKLGESILSATVVQWFKKVGETVRKDEPLLEVSTDKINSEIPSPISGILKEICARPEEELQIGDLLAVITTNEKVAVSSLPSTSQTETATLSTEKTDYYSPAILRLAREKGLDLGQLSTISGTGSGGRITKKDLEGYLARKPSSHLSMGLPCTRVQSDVEQVKMSAMRKAIAENMVRSFYGAPHASLISEVDVTQALKVIQKERAAILEKHNVKLTISSFIARAIARSLQQFPFLNSSLDEDTIFLKRFVNLGIAVSVEQGILVPVIKHCQALPLIEIARALAELSQKARQGTLHPDEINEGTITLTNFGMSGVQIGIPIIRYPEVAIIGVGAIQKRVIPLENDLLAIRSTMYLSLTFDHRVIDGMYGCEFLASVKKRLETDLEI